MSRPFNPIALAILALLYERPMHPYEIAFTMRKRHLEGSIKLNFGSLYHNVETLERKGLLESAETEREGRRPERTVYRLTDLGRGSFLQYLRGLIREPATEFSDFEAGLCFLWHLCADEAVALLRERAAAIEKEQQQQRQAYTTLIERGLARLALVEVEHALAMREAELQWVRTLIEEIEGRKLEWQPSLCNITEDNS